MFIVVNCYSILYYREMFIIVYISHLFETVSTLNDWALWIGDLTLRESDIELLFAQNKTKVVIKKKWTKLNEQKAVISNPPI